MAEETIVRKNLMSQPGYSPYCGAEICRKKWPRTEFNGRQFVCSCGWKSEFPDDFMDRYKKYRESWAK